MPEHWMLAAKAMSSEGFEGSKMFDPQRQLTCVSPPEEPPSMPSRYPLILA